MTTSGTTLPEKALRYLGLHPDNPATWVLAALAHKYALDPLLNEVAVIQTKQGLKPYVTRDGLLTIAHRSGVFDGLTVDELREGEHGWAATVTVWRKDMSHGFTYSAGCGRAEPQAQQGHGPEMALARAERRALHRAFNIPAAGDVDEVEVEVSPVHRTGGAPSEEVGTTPSPRSVSPGATVPMMTPEQTVLITERLDALGLGGLEQRAPRLRLLGEAVGRELADTRTITYAEAELILDALDAALRQLAEPDVEPVEVPDADEGEVEP